MLQTVMGFTIASCFRVATLCETLVDVKEGSRPRSPRNHVGLRGLLLSTMGLGRVELPTSRLSGVRSNYLSYRPYSRPDLIPTPASDPSWAETRRLPPHRTRRPGRRSRLRRDPRRRFR